jgi:ankyrin repeat protein
MRTGRLSASLGFLSLFLLVLFAGGRGQAAGDNEVVTAARDGDVRAVRALIARRANVNDPARDGSTALLWAVYNSDIEMARTLLSAGASVNTPNKYGVTPLLQASRTGDMALIGVLLKAGADAKLAHPDGETAVMAASRAGRADAVKALVEAGADANVATYQDETALMWAAAEGHADVIKALLDAKADPNRKARVTTIADRKNSDHPTGGMTALMYAARGGHEAAVRALMAGGADPKLTNGDGVTAMAIAIVNDRLDLAGVMLDLGADANDGSLYFAVDMHDATSDMRAKDGSRLRADHPNTLTTLDLVKRLLDKGADPNKAFTGKLHSTTLCCGEDINASGFYRAAVAADVEALKLMLAHGAQVEWVPPPPAGRGGRGAPAGLPGRGGGGRTPLVAAMGGGRGAAFNAGPGFERLGPPPFREESNRSPLDAVKVLLAAGANPNVKGADGSTPLHQAVTARQVDIIRTLVAAGAKLDAVDRQNQTPLLLAEKPEPPPPPGNNSDARAWRPKRDSREDVIAAVRQLMGLGPNDPAPVPPPLPKPAGPAAGPAGRGAGAAKPDDSADKEDKEDKDDKDDDTQ